MSVMEIQREITDLSDEDLRKVSACLVSERRKREGIDLDDLVERGDREGRRVDWETVKDDVMAEPDTVE